MAMMLLSIVPRQVTNQQRARADNTHLSNEDIEKLRQFI